MYSLSPQMDGEKMNLQNRLKSLEQVQRAGQPIKIFIHYEGTDYGTCNGERLTLAEWAALAGPDDVKINVTYDKKEMNQ
jgi:hypothetical protein